MRVHGDAAGVQEREAARAVGRLDHAGLDAGLAHRGRLLVACHAEHRHRRAQDVGRRDAQLARAIDHLGQHRRRHAEQLQQVGVPGALADIEQQACGWHWWRRSHGPCRRSAATAGSISIVPAASAPLLGRSAAAGHVIAGSRRSWCRRNRDRAAGRSCPTTIFSCPARRQVIAVPCGAAVLPDDGVVHRLAGRAIPHHRRLALVGDADAGQRRGVELGLGERAAADLDRRAPDLLGIVLDPARLGEDLRQLLLRRRDRLARRHRTRWRACWSCPGRWRGCAWRPSAFLAGFRPRLSAPGRWRSRPPRAGRP